MEFAPIMSSSNTRQQESNIGRKYSRRFQTKIRQVIGASTVSDTGALLKTKVSHRIRHGRLDRIEVTGPDYGFKLHYGFEGVRSNGRQLKIEPTNHLNVLADSTVLHELADEISGVRADAVVAEIKI